MSMDNETISAGCLRRDAMLEPDEVTAMLRLRKLGWGSKRLAREFGCSRTTVKRYLGSGRWRPYQRRASRHGTPPELCEHRTPQPVSNLRPEGFIGLRSIIVAVGHGHLSWLPSYHFRRGRPNKRLL